jgi:hypothetical protein
MSQLGQLGILYNRRAMSASARKADIASHRLHVGLVPVADIRTAAKADYSREQPRGVS